MSVRSFVFLACVLFLSGCVPLFSTEHGSSATGTITGSVVDSRNRPVAGAEVQAIYLRGWTTIIPPVPNGFLVGSAHTDGRGQFSIVTSKRVDQLWAHSNHPASIGELHSVSVRGNVVRIIPSEQFWGRASSARPPGT